MYMYASKLAEIFSKEYWLFFAWVGQGSSETDQASARVSEFNSASMQTLITYVWVVYVYA